MPFTRQDPPFVDKSVDPNGPSIDAAWHNKADKGVGDAHDELATHVTALEDFTNEARNVIMSGGGTISWGVVADKMKWTARFVLLPVSENVSGNQHVSLDMPTSGVTSVTGAERASVDGITLNTWESLWLVHTRGGTAFLGNSWKVIPYADALNNTYFDDENAYLIAVRNGDATNGSLYIRNGLVLPPGRTIAEGRGAMAPLWGEVDGKPETFTPTDASVTALKMAAENKGVVICESTTRPVSPVKGQHIYEIDTEATLKNNGTPAAPVWTAVGAGAGGAVAADAPLAGDGTTTNHLRMPAATASAAGHMTAAAMAKLDETKTQELAFNFSNDGVRTVVFGAPKTFTGFYAHGQGKAVFEKLSVNQHVAPDDFTDAAWLKTDIIVTANAANDIYQALVADKLDATALVGNTFQIHTPSGSLVGRTWEFSIWLRVDSTNLHTASLTLTANTLTSADTRVNLNPPLTGTWQRYVIRKTFTDAASTQARAYIFPGGSTSAGAGSQSTGYAYAYGARLREVTVPTFPMANAADEVLNVTASMVSGSYAATLYGV